MRRGYYNKRATQVKKCKCDRYCSMSLDFSGEGNCSIIKKNMKMTILWPQLRFAPNKRVPFIFLSSYCSLEDMICRPVRHF